MERINRMAASRGACLRDLGPISRLQRVARWRVVSIRYLEPIDEHCTRLMIRMRDNYRWFNPPVLAMQLAVDVGDIFFQWKHRLGVKVRADRLAKLEAASRLSTS